MREPAVGRPAFFAPGSGGSVSCPPHAVTTGPGPGQKLRAGVTKLSVRAFLDRADADFARGAQMRRYVVVVAALASGCAAEGPMEPQASLFAACEWESATRVFDLPWGALTDQQLYEETKNACGRVLVGFKEAGQPRGVDGKGVALTSPETVARMKELLRELGVVIEHEYDLPAVAGWMQPTLELVTYLRHHRQVDYLEPIVPGTRW
jgi:hypothetical protein